MPLSRTFTLALVAAVANGIAQSQSGTANTALTLNGSLVTGGVAIFDTARRVIVTSAGNDSNKTFTIVGTDYFGITQTEVLTGGNGAVVAQTIRDFATVTSITPSANTASTVTAGTNGVASSPPWIVDGWANPPSVGVGTVTNTVPATYTVEIAYDNLFPNWDLKPNPPTYFPVENMNAINSNAHVVVTDPITMIRTTILSGTGSVTTNFRQAFSART